MTWIQQLYQVVFCLVVVALIVVVASQQRKIALLTKTTGQHTEAIAAQTGALTASSEAINTVANYLELDLKEKESSDDAERTPSHG